MLKYQTLLLTSILALMTVVLSAKHIEPPKDKLVIEPIPLNLKVVSGLIQYPEHARSQGIEGELPVQVLINTKGKIIAHRYPSENSVYFKEAVNPHLKKIRFKSASYNGKPMRAWITIHFNFELTDE